VEMTAHTAVNVALALAAIYLMFGNLPGGA
jgi:hypothetical protein